MHANKEDSEKQLSVCLFRIDFYTVTPKLRGPRWRSWLRHYATNRKVWGSIPDGVIGIFHWHNPSSRTMALGLTHPLTEMSKAKVKWSCYRPGVAQKVGRGIALLFHDRGTRREWVVSSTPRPQFTPGKDRRLGGSQGRSGRAENLVPTGIRSRTVQPVVSRYTDWATDPTYLTLCNMFWF